MLGDAIHDLSRAERRVGRLLGMLTDYERRNPVLARIVARELAEATRALCDAAQTVVRLSPSRPRRRAKWEVSADAVA